MRVAILLLAGGLAGAAPTAAAPSSGPSFDCARAASPIEKAICANGGAAAYDRDLARLFNQVLAALPGEAQRAALRESQRAWVKQRDRTCQSPPPPQTIATCLGEVYARRQSELHAWGLPRLPVEMMPDDALAAAYGARRDAQTIVAAAFSPDGGLLAFTTGPGAGEAVWLYDFQTRALFAATTIPPKETTATIAQFYWVGQTLYGEGQYGPVDGPAQPMRFAATKAGGRTVSTLPPAPVAPGEAKDTTDANANGGERQEEDARFTVASVNHGHGAFSLIASDKAPRGLEWTLQNGGAELGAFVFDAPRKRVLYMGLSGLVVYDLAAHRPATFRSPAGTVLGVSPDGARAALAVQGPCDSTAPTTGPAHICLVQLP